MINYSLTLAKNIRGKGRTTFMQQNGASKEVQALMDLPGSTDLIGEENGFSLLGRCRLIDQTAVKEALIN